MVIIVCFVAVWRSDSDTLFVFLRGKLHWIKKKNKYNLLMIKKSVCYFLFKFSQAGFQWFLHRAAGEDGHRAQSEGGRVACGASAWTVSSKHATRSDNHNQAAVSVWNWNFGVYISYYDCKVIVWRLISICTFLFRNVDCLFCHHNVTPDGNLIVPVQ